MNYILLTRLWVFVCCMLFFDQVVKCFESLKTYKSPSIISYHCVVCSLPTFHFDIIKVSLVSWIELQKLSVLPTGHGRNACGFQSFLSLIIFISVE